MELLRAAVIDPKRNRRSLTLREVQAYMYQGFSATGEPDDTIRVVGRDWHGFTLDAIIDRLASGMIYATESIPTAAEDAADSYRRFNP